MSTATLEDKIRETKKQIAITRQVISNCKKTPHGDRMRKAFSISLKGLKRDLKRYGAV